MSKKIIEFACFSNECDVEQIEKAYQTLSDDNIELYMSDLTGKIIWAALDFVALDYISIGYSVLQMFFQNGTYDIVKQGLIYLWGGIRGKNNSRVPFTINVSGVPFCGDTRNLSFKVDGKLNNKQKEKVIDNAFEVVKMVAQNEILLHKESLLDDNLFSHVFYIGGKQLETHELNVEAVRNGADSPFRKDESI